jgi:hypothetical protein
MVGIGCFMAWIGGMSGAMIAVLVSKFVAFLTRAPSVTAFPRAIGTFMQRSAPASVP